VYYGALGQNVPLDAVNEFRVVTSNFSAEYGRASGGIINVATRAGSNSFHGTAYEFNRISRLASNGFNNNANGIPRGVFSRNQFGYTIGGRIIRDKLFFFNSTEWTRVRSAGDLLCVVPTTNLLNASAAATRDFFSAYQLQATPTGTAYSVGTLVNTFNIPAGNAFAALPADLPAFQLVRFSVPTNLGGGVPQNAYSLVARVDYNLSDKTLLYGRWAREYKDFPVGSTAFSPYAGFDTASTNRYNNFLVSLTHTFSTRPGFRNEAFLQPAGDRRSLRTQSGGTRLVHVSGINRNDRRQPDCDARLLALQCRVVAGWIRGAAEPWRGV
jgi:hypothetical protein